jgi:hypothetical protein
MYHKSEMGGMFKSQCFISDDVNQFKTNIWNPNYYIDNDNQLFLLSDDPVYYDKTIPIEDNNSSRFTKYESVKNVKNIVFYGPHILYQNTNNEFQILSNLKIDEIIDPNDKILIHLNQIPNIVKFEIFRNGLFCITEDGDMYIMNDKDSYLFHKNVKSAKYENKHFLILTKDNKLLAKFDEDLEINNDRCFFQMLAGKEFKGHPTNKIGVKDNCVELLSNVKDFTFYYDNISEDYKEILVCHSDGLCYFYFFDLNYEFVKRVNVDIPEQNVIQLEESSDLSVYSLTDEGNVYSLSLTSGSGLDIRKVSGVENVERIQYTKGTGGSFLYVQR